MFPGFDNSGQRGTATWATQQSNVERTVSIIESLAQEFSDPKYADVVTALALLNEPAGYVNTQLLDTSKQFNSGSMAVGTRSASPPKLMVPPYSHQSTATTPLVTLGRARLTRLTCWSSITTRSNNLHSGTTCLFTLKLRTSPSTR
jgi:hypothetical protein